MFWTAVGSLAVAVWGGCVSMVAPPAGSRCALVSAEMKWTNAPSVKEPGPRVSRQPYDVLLADAALMAGVKVQGTQRFAFSAKGRYLVEVFLANPEADRFTFRLSGAKGEMDARPVIAPGPGRMRPKRNLRHTSLLAVVDGPQELTVTSEAPWYVLFALRWTPVDEMERDLAPRWRARVAELHRSYLTEAQGSTARRAWMQQLGDRMAFSGDAAVRQEALLARMRGWFWLAAENHEPDDILQTDLLFREGLRVMPGNAILRQTISAACTGQVVQTQRMPRGEYCASVQPVAWAVDVPSAPAGAPEWAVAQRRLMARMDAITRWWVEKRQSANGELGGGWGDDVEILRHWGPQALGFGSDVAARGIRNVAGGLWNSGTLLNGYDKGISDVEHSSEPTTDTQPLAAALHPEDGELRARLGQTAACSESWLKTQPDGFLRFRSSWFNCREADTANGRDVDVHLNTRAMGPALWYAYLSRDPALIARIAAWADSWIRAMRDTRHGKPAGIFPSVLRAADGEYLIGKAGWDKPEAEWDYFQWSGRSQEALTSLLLAVYDLTGSKKYLDAAGESFAVLEDCGKYAALCAEMRGAPEAYFAWRGLSGRKADGVVLAEMTKMAREAEARFAVNWDIYTTEVLYTDRVYYPLPAEYRWYLFGGEAPRGDRYPTFAVTWPAGGEFARAVLAAGEREVRVRAYSFAAGETMAEMRLWRLKPGAYRWSNGSAGGEFTVTKLPYLLRVPLPGQREVTVTVN
ncbi:MAG: hypothetical protein JST93_10020 [Acidobacteria bacterium]|nr:hypothetical protein [Acidobacteriota bacterium]